MIISNFIVFEGIDGAGTTTQLNILKDKLKGKPAWFTFEPTARETGVFLRNVLKGDIVLHPDTTARLFAADRCEHLYGKDGIIERTQNGELVVCDRYLFSNLAYQSSECGDSLPKELNKSFPLPQIVFYFDLSPDISINRITGRGVTEIYEKKDFLEKTRSNYIRIMKEYEDKTQIIYLDATQSVESISQKIWSVLENLPMMKP
ncbi:MAG: dTMP kinase [Treponemataceae bacterium]|nr:dTMP kinase [Treponemataceae bacterium]